MTPITPEDMRAIAEKVYPEQKWLIYNGALAAGEVISYSKESGPQFNNRFNPSLTGTGQQKEQACDVIAYVDKLYGAFAEYGPNKNWPYGYWLRGFKCSITAAKERDILTAAMKALLEATR